MMQAIVIYKNGSPLALPLRVHGRAGFLAFRRRAWFSFLCETEQRYDNR